MPRPARTRHHAFKLSSTDIAGNGTDSLVTITSDGSVAASFLTPGQGLGAPLVLGRIDTRNITGPVIAGTFGTDPFPQLLYTTTAGTTMMVDKANWNIGGEPFPGAR